MKLAMSNIAWAPGEFQSALDLMQQFGAKGLEIAPGLAFPDEADAFAPTTPAVTALRKQLSDCGIDLVSMQSLLFGVQGAKLFGDDQEVHAFTTGITRAIGLAEVLGIPNLVMGSPQNRAIPDGMSKDAAWASARDIFGKLGDLAVKAHTRIALEPNPSAYGTNFMTTLREAAEFCRLVDHPGVTVNFDIGAMHMNDEFGDAAAQFDLFEDVVSHVHVSEPQLAPAPEDADGFSRLATHLAGSGYDRWISIEMRRFEADPLGNVKRALAICSDALVDLEGKR